MARPVTLFTGQWADLKFEKICEIAKECGFDGLELACWGDHFDVYQALEKDSYCREKLSVLEKYNLKCYAISNHLVGQAICDKIDERHKKILPKEVWGDGKPEKVNERASKHMIAASKAAKLFGVKIVNGFTGSPIWHLIYPFPPINEEMIFSGYNEFKERFLPILDEFKKNGAFFALEVHPSEIAFDIVSAEKALEALGSHPSFGFNYDPSHLGYQGVDYIKFIEKFYKRIFHVHIKDVFWQDKAEAGVFGGYLNFGDPRRYWDFRSVGRGSIDFEKVIRAFNYANYSGPLSIEWEDSAMDRIYGAKEACAFIRKLDFTPCSSGAFDDAFSK